MLRAFIHWSFEGETDRGYEITPAGTSCLRDEIARIGAWTRVRGIETRRALNRLLRVGCFICSGRSARNYKHRRTKNQIQVLLDENGRE